MNIKDGELPAYPFASDVCGHHGGMTMRDAFAMAALQGGSLRTGVPMEDHIRRFIAAQCYAMADAMLAERSKQ